MLVPAFDAGPLREAWRALATAWARRAVATDGDGGRVVALMDATRGAVRARGGGGGVRGDGRAVETLRATTHESRRRRYALVTLAVRDARA